MPGSTKWDPVWT